MQLARTVQTEPYRKSFLGQKPAPFFVEKRAVGLEPIDDRPAGRAILALEGDDPAKTVQPERGRLAAVPGKTDDIVGRGGDMLGDIRFEDVVRHARRRGAGYRRLLSR